MSRLTRTAALAATLVLVLAAVATPALADAGDKLLRTRLIYISPNDGGTDVLSSAEVEYDITVEVDFTYFFTENIAFEGILATATQEVRVPDLSGDLNALGDSLGSVHHAPTTFLAQYHFNPGGTDFYVGAGINYTIFYGESGVLENLSLDSASFGYAAQIGVDVPLGDNAVFNLDLKYITIATDVELDGTNLGEVEVDPFVLGFGVGFRF